MKSFIYNSWVLLVLLLINSCKTSERIHHLPTPLPENYSLEENEYDSIPLHWRQVFKDTVLTNLIQIGLENNLDIKQALERIEMARANIRYTRGLNLPFVYGTGSAGIRRFGEYTMDGVGNYDTNFSPNVNEDQKMERNLPDFMVGFQTSWEIDAWGKFRNKRKSAQAKYLGSVEARNWLTTLLIAEIATSYYEWVALKKSYDILEETSELQEQGLEVVKLQKLVGKVNELAVNQFEAQLYNFQAQSLAAQLKIFQIENKINFLLGRYPEEIKTNLSTFNDSFIPHIPKGTPTQLIQRRADIKEAELAMIAAGADLAVAKAAIYPSLNLQGLIGFQTFNPSFFLVPSSLTYQIFGSTIAPLVNRNGLKANIQFSQAAQKESFFHLEQKLINAFAEVINQSMVVDLMGQKEELKQNEVKALLMASQNSSRLFATGRATYLEVIIAQENALSSQLELIDIQMHKFQAFVNLYKSLGGG